MASALFSFCLSRLPLTVMVEQLLLPAYTGSSNVTFTNENDANPIKFRLQSQHWVDTDTIAASHLTTFRWICGSYKDSMINCSITIYQLYICMCVVIHNHTNYIFDHFICGCEANDTDESKIILSHELCISACLWLLRITEIWITPSVCVWVHLCRFQQ